MLHTLSASHPFTASLLPHFITPLPLSPIDVIFVFDLTDATILSSSGWEFISTANLAVGSTLWLDRAYEFSSLDRAYEFSSLHGEP